MAGECGDRYGLESVHYQPQRGNTLRSLCQSFFIKCTVILLNFYNNQRNNLYHILGLATIYNRQYYLTELNR